MLSKLEVQSRQPPSMLKITFLYPSELIFQHLNYGSCTTAATRDAECPHKSKTFKDTVENTSKTFLPLSSLSILALHISSGQFIEGGKAESQRGDRAAPLIVSCTCHVL